MNIFGKLVNIASRPARVAWSVGIVAVLAACFGGSDAPLLATADVSLGASNVTVAQKTQTAGALVAVTSGGTAATPLTFATGFSGVDANGAAVSLPAVPTTVSFTANAADSTQPNFVISSADGSAEGSTALGSCTFTVTKTSFKAPHPLSSLTFKFKIDPCTVTLRTNGIAADGSNSSVTTFAVFGSKTSATILVTVTVKTDGTMTINKQIIPVTLPTGATTTTTTAGATTTTAAGATTTTAAGATTTTAAGATTTTAAGATTTTAAGATTTTAAGATTTTAAATTTTAAATTTTAAATTTTAAATTTTAAATTTTTTTTTTQPAVTSGPTLSAVTGTGATLTVTSNQAGTGYYLVKAMSAATPTYNQVLSGTGFALTAGTASTATITGLTPATQYNLYFVPTNSAGSTGQMSFVAFATGVSTGATGGSTGAATTGGSPP